MKAFETLKSIVDFPLYAYGFFNSAHTGGVIAAVLAELNGLLPEGTEFEFELKNSRAKGVFGKLTWQRVAAGGMFIMLNSEQPFFVQQWTIVDLISNIRKGKSFSDIRDGK
jgi:hypothetical protein